MHIAILTFEDFNELDSFVALALLNRVKKPDWRVTLCCPQSTVTSMNGVVVHRQSTLEELTAADAVLVDSGVKTREIVNDSAIMAALRLDPERQLIGGQCSGALILAKLGILANIPACTDLTTKPWMQEAGVEVINQPFHASGNVATAGGCLASQRNTAQSGHPSQEARNRGFWAICFTSIHLRLGFSIAIRLGVHVSPRL